MVGQLGSCLRLSAASAVLTCALSLGCAKQAQFLDARCERVQATGELREVAFRARIATRGLVGEQLVYRVRLQGPGAAPVASSNGLFRDQSGAVAATKTLMVMESPWTFEDVRIAIPAYELELRPEDLPASAEFAVLSANGALLAQTTQPLPVWQATRGVLASRPPAPQEASAPDADRLAAEAPADAEIVEAPVPAMQPEPTEAPPVARSASESDPSDDQPLAAAAPPPEDDLTPRASPEAEAAPARAATPPRGGYPQEASPVAARRRAEPAPPAPAPTREVPAASRPAGRAPRPQAAGDRPTAGASTTDLARRRIAAEFDSAPPAKHEGRAIRPVQEQGAAQPAATQPAHRLYTVQEGDTLTGIAKSELGDASRWVEIYELNASLLASPNYLTIGQKLRIPKRGE